MAATFDWTSGDFNWEAPSIPDAPHSAVDSSGNGLSGLQIPSFLKLGSSILKGFGDLEVGKQEAGAYEYNAQLAEDEGSITQYQLGYAEEGLLSTQRAMYAKAGVTQSGSPLDVAVQSATQAEMDKQIARYNTESKANMYRYEAQVAQSQSKIKAGEDLLTGALSIGMMLL